MEQNFRKRDVMKKAKLSSSIEQDRVKNFFGHDVV